MQFKYKSQKSKLLASYVQQLNCYIWILTYVILNF